MKPVIKINCSHVAFWGPWAANITNGDPVNALSVNYVLLTLVDTGMITYFYTSIESFRVTVFLQYVRIIKLQ